MDREMNRQTEGRERKKVSQTEMNREREYYENIEIAINLLI